MKKNRITLAIATLALCLSWRVAAASSVMSPELEQSLRVEVDAVGKTIEQIDALLKTTEKGKVSPEAAAAHRDATAQYKEAKTLLDARKYEEGYGKLRAAKTSAMQAASELVAKGVAVPIDKIVASFIDVGASRVKAVSDSLAGKSSPDATAAYQEGEKLYQSAKSQYTAGQHREAYKTLDASLLKLDEAIRILWKDKGPQADAPAAAKGKGSKGKRH